MNLIDTIKWIKYKFIFKKGDYIKLKLKKDIKKKDFYIIEGILLKLIKKKSTPSIIILSNSNNYLIKRNIKINSPFIVNIEKYKYRK